MLEFSISVVEYRLLPFNKSPSWFQKVAHHIETLLVAQEHRQFSCHHCWGTPLGPWPTVSYLNRWNRLPLSYHQWLSHPESWSLGSWDHGPAHRAPSKLSFFHVSLLWRQQSGNVALIILLALCSLHGHQFCLFPRKSIYSWWLILDQVDSKNGVTLWLGSLFPTERFRGFSYLCADLMLSSLLWNVDTVTHIESYSASSTHHINLGPDGSLYDQAAISMAPQAQQIHLLIFSTQRLNNWLQTWEVWGAWAVDRGNGRFTTDLEIPIPCLALISESLELAKSILKLSPVKTQ